MGPGRSHPQRLTDRWGRDARTLSGSRSQASLIGARRATGGLDRSTPIHNRSSHRPARGRLEGTAAASRDSGQSHNRRAPCRPGDRARRRALFIRLGLFHVSPPAPERPAVIAHRRECPPLGGVWVLLAHDRGSKREPSPGSRFRACVDGLSVARSSVSPRELVPEGIDDGYRAVRTFVLKILRPEDPAAEVLGVGPHVRIEPREVVGGGAP
jgi:hypothetical protein